VRILHIIPSLSMRSGGPSQGVPELCAELVRFGHQVTLYTTNLDGPWERLDLESDRAIQGSDGVERWYFSTQRGTGAYALSLSMMRALRRNVRGFDVVHVHSLYSFPATVAAYYCRRHGVPYILQPHGSLDPSVYYRHRPRKNVYEALFEKRNLARAAAVHFATEEEMRLVRAWGLQFRGVVVPYGLAAKAPFDRDQLRERFAQDWPTTRGKKVILFFGRLSPKKGLDLLSKAYGTLARERPDIHLFLAGPDIEGEGIKVRQWLSEERVLDRVTFAGLLQGDQKLAALASSDLFVLCSYGENFGIAIAEAAAAGLPVVISNKVNIWREFNEARAGLVVNCDVDELARAIATLLDNSELCHELGEAGKKLVAKKFMWPDVVLKMTTVYRDAITKNANLYSTETSSA
jgi:glycosyltransferase involved in cell wall biosynthesis